MRKDSTANIFHSIFKSDENLFLFLSLSAFISFKYGMCVCVCMHICLEKSRLKCPSHLYNVMITPCESTNTLLKFHLQFCSNYTGILSPSSQIFSAARREEDFVPEVDLTEVEALSTDSSENSYDNGSLRKTDTISVRSGSQ